MMFGKYDISSLRPLLFVLLLGCLTGGCSGPRLASAPLTPEQAEWVGKLERWHPGWDRPYMSPIRRQHRVPSSTTRAANFKSPGMPVSPPAFDDSRDVDEVILVPVNGNAAEDGAGRQYAVEKGDTLSKIALQFYDDASDWKRIWNANRDILTDPGRLTPGMVLDIPAAQ